MANPSEPMVIEPELVDPDAEKASERFEEIEARAGLAGSNRFEILLFSLGTSETFGINVFKVREVMATPFITRAPNVPPGVEGLVSLRGNVIPVVSLAKVMELAPMDDRIAPAMMVAEYCRKTLGFLVDAVDRIIRVEWSKVREPENVSSQVHGMITSITELPDGRLVSIIDVEAVLAKTFGEAVVGVILPIPDGHRRHVFFVDDSSVARKKIAEVLDKLGVKHTHANNGMEAWERLQSMANFAEQTGTALRDQLDVILTDAEMPEMDGYVLTKNIKADSRFDGIPVIMYSSLTSQANRAMGERVGVDGYVEKFDAQMLAETLRPLLMR